MKDFLFLLFFMCAVLRCATCAFAAGGCTTCPQQGQCTIEVPVSAEVAIVSTAGHPVAAVAGRSIGAVRKVAAVPVRVVGKVIEANPLRKIVKAVAKARPGRRVVKGVRLVCPRLRCCRN